MNFMMMIGCSGSGKSTIARTIQANKPDVVVISSSSILEDYAKAEGISYEQARSTGRSMARDISEQMLAEAFDRGLDVVWDHTCLHRPKREKILSLVPDEYRKVGVFLTGSRDAHLQRLQKRKEEGGRNVLAQVLDYQMSTICAPDYDEGFDQILKHQVAKLEEEHALSF
jgi:predicted kinase